ncbi:MAG TPA: hypothetical protein VJ783_08840 [Pirellulales bacterium]|nr:hypothetical protein [Pirellulales bacterium]
MPQLIARSHQAGCDAHALAQQRSAQSSPDELLSAARRRQFVWAFVLLGLAARAVRYLLRFPLWEDECFLAYNFIDQTFTGLLRPLNYHQVAPLGFLWVELTLVKLFGFHEVALRLFAFGASVGSVLLFRHLAGRLLSGTAQVLAVAIFCVSYSGIRYAAEAKPYGPDQFVALALLTLAVEWRRRPDQRRWLAALVAAVPVAIGVSYPAVFVAGGVSLWMAAVLLDERRRGWLGWLLFNAVLAASFGAMLALAAKSQAAAELGYMQNYWKDHLPSLASPLQFAWWFLLTHTGDLLAIPLGGERGASTLSFLIVACGVAALARQRRTLVLLLCLAPPAWNMAAALMGRFPYGGHVKFSQYLAPAICILLGAGGAALLARGQALPQSRRRGLAAVLGLLALIAIGTIARDFCLPYKSATDRRYRDFARWFWFSMESSGEVACLQTDLMLDFAPGTFRDLGWSAMYLCNQRIYSPRHARGNSVDWQAVSADWPLRCVEYQAEVYRYDRAARDRWLATMQKRYELVARERFDFPVFDQRGRNLLCADAVEIYKFVPRAVHRPPASHRH